MKQIKLKIGDIFEVNVEHEFKKYFQFIGTDDNQLESDVIRVFATPHKISVGLNPADIITGPVEFYAHCVVKVGVKYEYWRKIGHHDEIGAVKPLFRSSKDFGRDEIKISNRWEVWELGQPRKFIGCLGDDFLSAEPGEVFPPLEIIHRMRFGRYKQSIQE